MLAVGSHKPSIVLSTDESRVFTFTSSAASNTVVASDCRMDVFDISDLTTSVYTKAEHSIQERHCRFPEMFTQATDMSGTEHIIMLITEYFSATPQAGFMRINMNASYQ